jgi:signal transduction histidine kinase
MSLGADDFITKPFSNIDLLNTVRNRIKKSKKLKQEMEKLKNSILRSLPHEFLTPLNTIQGFSELILQTINDSEILDKLELKEHVEYIHEASFKLERIARNYILISEILTKYDHIPEKHLLIEHKVEEVIPLLEKFILNYANTRDREEDIHLNLETIYSLKINEENLLKIITEILDNSIKFSNKGSKIEVNGSIHGLDYAISIRDYGKGMNFEEVKQIDLFKQFNREKVEQQGLGMGLFIVQKILELYNGKIKINHELQTGIEITVLIPVVG